MNRTSRRARGIIIGILVAAVPLTVFAADLFTDVPDTRNDHDAIGNIANAGVSVGDPANSTTYQPTKAVTRGAMSTFLNRGLGRVAYSGNGADAAVTTSGTDLGVATLTSGGVASDGAPITETTSFFKADASFTVTCTAACDVDVVLSDGTESSRVVNVTLAAAGTEHGSITWANDFPAASDAVLTLTATAAADATASAAGEVTAIYSPFGAEGTNTLDPAP